MKGSSPLSWLIRASPSVTWSLSREQITKARRAYKKSDERLKNGIEGSTPSEVVLRLRALTLAKAAYLGVLRSYDKAQVRLLVLLGAAGTGPSSDSNCPTPNP